MAPKPKYKSSLASHPLYSIWNGMMRRCYNEKFKDYSYYGGRGIQVYPAWHNYDNFYAEMADSFSIGLTLDRIDNNKNYEPDNVRWANRKVQANNRSSNRLIKNPHSGEVKTLEEWSDTYKISSKIVMQRYHKLHIRLFTVLFLSCRLPRDSKYNPEKILENFGFSEKYIKDDRLD